MIFFKFKSNSTFSKLQPEKKSRKKFKRNRKPPFLRRGLTFEKKNTSAKLAVEILSLEKQTKYRLQLHANVYGTL